MFSVVLVGSDIICLEKDGEVRDNTGATGGGWGDSGGVSGVSGAGDKGDDSSVDNDNDSENDIRHDTVDFDFCS